MTKLVKYLVIGGSATAVVGGAGAGAAVAISHKSSKDKNVAVAAKTQEQVRAEEQKQTFTEYRTQLVQDQAAYPEIVAALSKVPYDPAKTPEENQVAVEKVLEQEITKLEDNNKDQFEQFRQNFIATNKPTGTLLEVANGYKFNPRETLEFNKNEFMAAVGQINDLVVDPNGEQKAGDVNERLNKNVYLHTHLSKLNEVFQAILTGTMTTQAIYSMYPDEHELVAAYDELDKIPYLHDHAKLLESTFTEIKNGVKTLQDVKTDYGITN